eukprot:scaffold306_cov241-Pinguiococcus_pyrenoidosus.AAC.2
MRPESLATAGRHGKKQRPSLGTPRHCSHSPTPKKPPLVSAAPQSFRKYVSQQGMQLDRETSALSSHPRAKFFDASPRQNVQVRSLRVSGLAACC